jgi:hypothetical protein
MYVWQKELKELARLLDEGNHGYSTTHGGKSLMLKAVAVCRKTGKTPEDALAECMKETNGE